MRHHSRRARPAVVAIASVLTMLASLVTSALVLAPSAVADAEDGLAWSVTPAPPPGKSAAPRNYFILEGDPGTVIKDEILVQNWTPHPITFHLFGADGYNTDDAGAFALRSREDKQTHLGRWIKPGVKQVTVYGETAAKIPVTFRIPKDATPGDHVGGVVALNTRIETKSDGSVSVGIQRAIGARAYVRVNGKTVSGVEVSDVEVEHDRGVLPWTGEGRGIVTYTVKNTGNLRLSLDGTLKLSSVLRDISTEELPPLTDLLPGQSVTFTHEIDGLPSFGKVQARVSMEAGGGVGHSAETTVWLLPWVFVLALLIVVAAVGWWVQRHHHLLRRRLRAVDDAPRITVGADA